MKTVRTFYNSEQAVRKSVILYVSYTYNPNKIEYLLLNPNNVNLSVNIINLGSNTISPSDSAINLGIIFQTDMPMDKYISSL